MNEKETILHWWKQAVSHHRRKMTALLEAIGCAFQEVTFDDRTFRFSQELRNFAQRIAHSDRGFHASGMVAMGYATDWAGEWTVTNSDLKTVELFCIYVGREMEERSNPWTGPITEALKRKRLQQAFDRYKSSGLRMEHLVLMEKMLWDVDVLRGDWISLFVQGKRPLGDSSVAWSIWQAVGWPINWPLEEGMPEEQEERAWDLFDELIFAVPAAARHAAKSFSSEALEGCKPIQPAAKLS